MKRRILLLAIPALLGATLFFSLREPARSFETRPVAEVTSLKSKGKNLSQTAGSGESSEKNESQIDQAHFSPDWEVENLSGIELGTVPAGVRRVESVVFESRELESDGRVRRSRVLETDFHFPLVQTIEWLEIDASTGGETVDEYLTMVADHVMLQVDAKMAPSTWRDELAEHGFSVRQQIAEDGLYTVSFEIEEGDPVTAMTEYVERKFDWIEFVEPDYLLKTTQASPSSHLPNDPDLGKLWGLHNDGFMGEPEMDIRAFDAWKIRREAPEVIVAIIDTGIDYTHPDLIDNMWVNPREIANSRDDSGNGIIDDIHGATFLGGQGYGDPMDYDGHGTHVAGTIGAVGNNGIGVAGVAWNVQLMAVNFLGWGGGSTSDGIRAIDYAWQNGAHILNNSWGGDHFIRSTQNLPSRALERAIARSRDAGAIFVVAAGNSARNVDILPDYPSYHQNRVDNVVNVGAMDQRGHRASISNYGAVNVDVFAPGYLIYSTYPAGLVYYDECTEEVEISNGYACISGTSMAAPHVSGMFALLKAEFPNEPYNVLIERLLQRSTKDRILAPYAAQARRANLAAALNPAPLIYRHLEDQRYVPGAAVVLEVGVAGHGPFTYSWYKNDVQISAENSPKLVLNNAGIGDSGYYRVEVTSSAGSTFSEAKLTESPGNPALANALGVPFLKFESSSDAPWNVGAEGARSASIGDGRFSEISTVVSGPAKVSFSWKVSSEKHYDFGQFLLGETLQEEISGDSGWLSRTYAIPEGTHRLIWRYVKDKNHSAGDDFLQLKDVVYETLFPIIVGQSNSIEVVAGASINLSFESVGSDLTLYWMKGGRVIESANGGNLSLNNIGFEDAGVYIGAARNSHGTVETQPIHLTVLEEANPAIFSRHPESIAVIAGNSIELSASWSATHPYEARWLKDGLPLEAIGDRLSIPITTEQDSGIYLLEVTNGAGSVESFPAIVSVHPAEVTFSDWYSNVHDPAVDEEAALLHFALGADSPSDSLPANPRFIITSEPQIGLSSSAERDAFAGTQHAAILFTIPLNAEGIRYVLEVSDDLIEWNETEASLEFIGAPNGVKQAVQLRQIAPLQKDRFSQFFKLRIDNDDQPVEE